MLSQNLSTMLLGAHLLHLTLSAADPSLADDIVYSRVLPGMGLSLCFGCFYYALQAQVVAYMTGRKDLCAQPFGISTPGVFVFIASIVHPVFASTGRDAEATWQVACLANLMQGLMEIVCSAIGPYAAKAVSVGALLTALASIGLCFLLLQPMQAVAAAPVVGVLPLVLLLLQQLTVVRIPKLPTAILPVVVASILAWSTGHLQAEALREKLDLVGLHLPTLRVAALDHFSEAMQYIGIILPVSLTASIGTMQCRELAVTAGDDYSLRVSMLGDGIATVLAALCGCPFGFTVYIGHPALKQMGCHVGYNLLTGLVTLLVCCTGLSAVVLQVVPVEGFNAFVIFVGLVICVDGLKVMPNRHWVAFLLGLSPAACNWAIMQAAAFAEALWPAGTKMPDFTTGETWSRAGGSLEGLFCFGNGYILSAVCLCSIVASFVDYDFVVAAAWCGISAVLSCTGLIHAPRVFFPWQKPLDDIAWRFAFAYLSCALLFLGLRVLQYFRLVPPKYYQLDEETDRENGSFASVVGDRYAPKPSIGAGSGPGLAMSRDGDWRSMAAASFS